MSKADQAVAELLANLPAGVSLGLLQALHILTREGRINQDSRRKLKQVQHLLQFMVPELQKDLQQDRELVLVDHGAGKSYLGFMLYDQVLRPAGKGWVHGIESRADLVKRSESLAREWGFDRMRFHALTVREALDSPEIPQHVDWVTALHACDTATDDAIDFALHRQAEHVVLVPCCQAEAAACLRQTKALSLTKTPLSELWRHPLHTREFGSQITNVMRCLRLEASGYQVTVTELTGWEHSMKNELILAHRTGKPKHSAGQRLQELLDSTGLQALASRFEPVIPVARLEKSNGVA